MPWFGSKALDACLSSLFSGSLNGVPFLPLVIKTSTWPLLVEFLAGTPEPVQDAAAVIERGEMSTWSVHNVNYLPAVEALVAFFLPSISSFSPAVSFGCSRFFPLLVGFFFGAGNSCQLGRGSYQVATYLPWQASPPVALPRPSSCPPHPPYACPFPCFGVASCRL